MIIEIKTFSELTKEELYEILQLRNKVFVVEQNCIYQDIDAKDQKALHVLGYKKNKIIAYARVFKPNDYFTQASIGRVVVAKNERINYYGHQIVETSIQVILKYFNTSTIKISAQKHLEKFYQTHKFKAVGKEYLEDGIPHITMFFNKKI